MVNLVALPPMPPLRRCLSIAATGSSSAVAALVIALQQVVFALNYSEAAFGVLGGSAVARGGAIAMLGMGASNLVALCTRSQQHGAHCTDPMLSSEHRAMVGAVLGELSKAQPDASSETQFATAMAAILLAHAMLGVGNALATPLRVSSLSQFLPRSILAGMLGGVGVQLALGGP